MDRKYWIGIGTALIVLPVLIFGRDSLVWVFAEAKQKVMKLEDAAIQQTQTQATLTELYQEQRQKNDIQDAQLQAQKEVTAAQVDALKSIVESLKK